MGHTSETQIKDEDPEILIFLIAGIEPPKKKGRRGAGDLVGPRRGETFKVGLFTGDRRTVWL